MACCPPSQHRDADGKPAYRFDDLAAHFGQTVEQGLATLDRFNDERATFGLPPVEFPPIDQILYPLQ